MKSLVRFASLRWIGALLALAAIGGPWLCTDAQAIPIFARQTGQNCLACHAGGQFPELTPYGRVFKLTGYTMGQRTALPLAVMGVVSMAKVSSKNGTMDAGTDFPHDGRVEFTTMSLFCCGKITDNFGVFAQWTNDFYDHQNDGGAWISASHVDQVDLRFADRFISPESDLIVGASLNNNPGVTDVWNTHNSAFTPVPTYVPVSNALASTVPFDVPAAPIDQALGQATAGLTAYAFWNNTVYAEVGAYKAADRALSLFNATPLDAMAPYTRLSSTAPYWRLALNHDWGPHSAMIGVHGLNATAYSDAADKGSPTAKFDDIGVDGQYQYILDPHVVTLMFSYTHEKQKYDDALWNPDNPGYAGAFANASNTLDYWRFKATYSYQAKYGAALAYTTVSGSADSIAYGGNDSNKPDSQLWVPEVFFMPSQYVRVGLQYYVWNKFSGTRSNYDPVNLPGRSASDNNAVFLYVWASY